MKDVGKIELTYLEDKDYEDLRKAMEEAYPSMPNAIWKESQIETLIKKFPKGQVAIKVNNDFAGCALTIIVDYEEFDHAHSYSEITGNFTFNTHKPEGDMLYGIDVFIKPKFRGLRLGRRLYDYRKELCERMNLKGIAFGGRIPNYHKYAEEMTPKEYIEKVRRKEIYDPVLNFQISNEFHPAKILKTIYMEILPLMNMQYCWNGIISIMKNLLKRQLQKKYCKVGFNSMADAAV